MSEEHIDLDALMAEIFGAQKPVEPKFYLWYNDFNQVVGLSGKFLEDYNEYDYIEINRAMFDRLTNDNIHNYIIDLSSNPPVPVDISTSDTVKNAKIPQVTEWVNNRILQIQYVKSNRKLHVNVKNHLPSAKKIWIIPAGNYMIPLLSLEMHQQGTFVYDVPEWQNSKSCWCISNQPIEIFTAYREVEHEEDL